MHADSGTIRRKMPARPSEPTALLANVHRWSVTEATTNMQAG
jgi:hypothetical protein